MAAGVSVATTSSFGTDDRGKVAERQATAERIDAHQERPVTRRPAQHIFHHLARQRLAWGYHGILEIENQRVGADTGCFREFVLAVGGHKQKGAQSHVGRLIIRPMRRQ
jgi:hypothetical protein